MKKIIEKTSLTKEQDINVDDHLRPISNNNDFSFERLISNWRLLEKNLNYIKYDASSAQGDKSKVVTIEFANYKLPSPQTGELKPLTDFPHVCHSLVFFVAERLIKNTNNSIVQTAITINFNIVLRFFYFLFLRNKYYLRDATVSDTNDFIGKLAKGGVHKALNLDKKYKEIQSRIKNDKKYASAISSFSRSKNKINLSLSTKMIRDVIGITPPRHNAPSYVYETAYSAIFPEEISKKINKGYDATSGLCNLSPPYMIMLNNLYLLSDETDRLTFLPFVDTNNTFRELTGKIYGKTENISIEDAISILKVCNVWMYEYADNLIKFGERWRYKIEEFSDLGINNRRQVLTDWINDYWSTLKEEKQLPTHQGDMTSVQFKTFLETLQTACVVMIAINNGRRKNEIIGFNQSFGLYFGCVKTIENGFINHHTIDIYIEKTVRDYCEMSCNKLTYDAVVLLEKVYVLLRPLGAKIPSYNQNIKEARKEKLLITKTFSENGLNLNSGKFRDNNEKYFYSLTNVKNTKLHTRHHPYRRMFAMLYFYRYKLSSLPALSQQLKHLNYEMTLIYINDDKTRLSKDRLEKLYKMYKAENDVMDGILTETEYLFLRKIVDQTLKGKTAGGLSKRITKIHKWLLRSTAKVFNSSIYKDINDTQKVKVLTDSLVKKGYGAKPRKHGVCGSNNKKGKCYDVSEGILKRENGTPSLCVKCSVHAFTSEFLENLREDKMTLNNDIGNYNLPRAVRTAAVKALENLEKLIALEEKMLSEALNNG